MTQPVPTERSREDMATLAGYDLGYKDASRDIAEALRVKAQEIRDTAWTPSVGLALAAIVDECAAVAQKFGEEPADVDS